ncbi:hypothetical protein POVCU2_0050490 [Plasmodium ovale curtisi]|uniref:Uncharacterized protein n=1 Tax=Plasmodium ovale curtisi TaxID=864141 RepID=A0A1A8WA02_PLAOA|nr:hypothetical protein POVCU2_0050490 [Plasmodium ovale curtisi]SBS98535.1 hypothetical protein POVCU1_046860 [Plasmodium ovale curtisi]
MSLCHNVAMPQCRYAAMSLCRNVAMPLYCYTATPWLCTCRRCSLLGEGVNEKHGKLVGNGTNYKTGHVHENDASISRNTL